MRPVSRNNDTEVRIVLWTKWPVNTVDGGIACSNVLEKISKSRGEKVGIKSGKTSVL